MYKYRLINTSRKNKYRRCVSVEHNLHHSLYRSFGKCYEISNELSFNIVITVSVRYSQPKTTLTHRDYEDVMQGNTTIKVSVIGQNEILNRINKNFFSEDIARTNACT